MKIIISIILIVLMCFSITACKENEKQIESYVSTSESSSDKTETSSTDYVSSEKENQFSSKNSTVNSTQKTPATSSEPDYSYQEMECVAAAGYQKVCFLPKNCKTYLSLTIPEEWKIVKSNGGFSVYKNSEKIGTIAENYKPVGEIMEQYYYSSSEVTIEHIVTKNGTNKYYHLISYNYENANDKNFKITVRIPYSVLNEDSLYEMTNSYEISRSVNKSNTGAMLLKDNRKKILILGNSFIATSQIGNILKEMCGDSISVEAQSRGLANTTTFKQDSYILDRISSGEFSALFICGFYSYDDAMSLGTFVNACNSSNTKIAIFPVHNEARPSITLAQEKFPDALLIDWKNEIDELIEGGISRSEFCVNDSYNHSTPLAGYVGAHMIYRAIFGRMPTQKSFSQVSDSKINLLGNYVNTGLTDGLIKDEYVIYEF